MMSVEGQSSFEAHDPSRAVPFAVRAGRVCLCVKVLVWTLGLWVMDRDRPA